MKKKKPELTEAKAKVNVEAEVSPLAELKKIPTTEWARIWCELNSWKIPKELEHIKPEWWDNNLDERAIVFLRPLMHHIEFTIGMKACNRYWNKDNMTDEEHEIFYRNNFQAG